MHAAVVTSFDAPPAYAALPTPTPQTADEVLFLTSSDLPVGSPQ
jgi:hypothetical protein